MKKQNQIIIALILVLVTLFYQYDKTNGEKRSRLFREASRLNTQFTALEEVIKKIQEIKTQVQEVMDKLSPVHTSSQEAMELYKSAQSKKTKLITEEQEVIEKYKAKVLEYNDIVTRFNDAPRSFIFGKSEMPHKIEKHKGI